MSYLFVVIGISVINALANSKMSYAEIFATNGIVSFAIFCWKEGLKVRVLAEIRLPLK